MHTGQMAHKRLLITKNSCTRILMTRILRIFFFQAEDGIRVRDVTGVQTCALPISEKSALADALGQACDEPREWRILAHLDVRLTNTAVVDELAATVIDLKTACTQDLECFFERIRALALCCAFFAAQLFAAGGGGARRRRRGLRS